MSFQHLRRGLTALVFPKYRFFISPSFGSKPTFGSTSLKSVISVPKATDGTKISCAIQNPLSHNTLRWKTTYGYKSQLSDDPKGFAREFSDFYEIAKAMIIAKNHDGASEFLIANLEAVKERLASGHKGIEEAIFLYTIGVAFIDMKDFDSLHSIVPILAEVGENVKEPEYDMQLCIVLHHLGLMYLKLEKLEESVLVLQRVNSIKKSNDMLRLAQEKRAMGDFNEAIRLIRDALGLLKGSRDENSLNVIRDDLAKLLHKVGREREGREILEECIEIAQNTNGKEDSRASVFMCNLGTSHFNSKNFGEAEKYLRTGLQNLAKIVGPDDFKLRIPMMYLSGTLCYLRQGEEAEQYALKALRISETQFGEDSPEFLEALDYLCAARVSQGKFNEKQMEMLNRSLMIKEKSGLCESEYHKLLSDFQKKYQ